MLQACVLCSIYLLNICSQNKMKHNNNNNNVALWNVVNLRFGKTILELVPQNDYFPALLCGSLSPACIIIVQLSVVVLKLWGSLYSGGIELFHGGAHDQDEKMWSGFEKLNKTVSCGNNKLTGVLWDLQRCQASGCKITRDSGEFSDR